MAKVVFPRDWQLVGPHPDICIHTEHAHPHYTVRVIRRDDYVRVGPVDAPDVARFECQPTRIRNILSVRPQAPLAEDDYVLCVVDGAATEAMTLSGICVKDATGYWARRFSSLLEQRRQHQRSRWQSRRWTVLKDRLSKLLPPLFSLTTTVYDTDPAYLEELCECIQQQTCRRFEWLILDNGSQRPETIEKIKELSAREERIRYFRVERNIHIIPGNRYLLERARGRYIVPIDSDDLVYPDALEKFAERCGVLRAPGLLFSDEQKVTPTGEPLELMWRPDWSPLHGHATCPAAHLMAFSRKLALQCGAYSDDYAQGCHDWDTFMRLTDAGVKPTHIPEVLYGWRMHAASSALNEGSKDYLARSQIAAVRASLRRRGLDDRFTVEPAHSSTLGYFHMVRQPVSAVPFEVDLILRGDRSNELAYLYHNLRQVDYPDVAVRVLSRAGALDERRRATAEAMGREIGLERLEFVEFHNESELGGLVSTVGERARCKAIVDCSLRIRRSSWLWEALGTFELDDHTGIVGGAIVTEGEKILHLGYVGGLDGFFNTPKRLGDLPSVYQAAASIRRHVSAVYSGLMVVRAEVFRACGPLEGVDSSDGVFGIEFCLRAHKSGFLTAYAPRIQAVRAEHLPEKVGEGTELRSRIIREYGSRIEHDPYYCRELARTSEDYAEIRRPEEAEPYVPPRSRLGWTLAARRLTDRAQRTARLIGALCGALVVHPKSLFKDLEFFLESTVQKYGYRTDLAGSRRVTDLALPLRLATKVASPGAPPGGITATPTGTPGSSATGASLPRPEREAVDETVATAPSETSAATDDEIACPELILPPLGLFAPADPLNIRLKASLAATPRLNVLLPALAMRCMSGGPNTALNITYRMAARGVPVRYIATGVPADEDTAPFWQHLQNLSGIPRRLPNVELINGHDRGVPFHLGENDVFFATAWWTAQMAKFALPLMKHKRFMYLIQDFEPGIREWSTTYALAMETYGLDFHPIINHRFLRDYLSDQKIGRFGDPRFVEQATIIHPAVDRENFYFEPPAAGRTRRLLVYARPTLAPRNMFELCVAALQMAARRGVFDGEPWEFLGMGEEFAPLSLHGPHALIPTPWKDFNGYARQMRQSDVLLSLMLSPHPSYPPLEMAACGGLVVTNTFATKSAAQLAGISANILGVEPTTEAIAEALREAVGRISDLATRERNSRIDAPANWDESLKHVLPQVMEAWESCLKS